MHLSNRSLLVVAAAMFAIVSLSTSTTNAQENFATQKPIAAEIFKQISTMATVKDGLNSIRRKQIGPAREKGTVTSFTWKNNLYSVYVWEIQTKVGKRKKTIHWARVDVTGFNTSNVFFVSMWDARLDGKVDRASMLFPASKIQLPILYTSLDGGIPILYPSGNQRLTPEETVIIHAAWQDTYEIMLGDLYSFIASVGMRLL